MIVFRIRCNFFIALCIRRKICRFNDFLFFARQNVRAQKIFRARLIGYARPRAFD